MGVGLGKNIRRIIFFSVLAFASCVEVSFAKGAAARIVRELSDLSLGALSFKNLEDEVFVLHHDWLELKYGMFEGDANPQDLRPWNIYDVLYVDVPVLYEAALVSMAEGKWADALSKLEKCGEQKTAVTKALFRKTDIYRNHFFHKCFICQLQLQNSDDALLMFDKVFANRGSHSRVQVMKQALPLLLEEGRSADALEVANELLGLRLFRRDLVSVSIQKAFALAGEKKFAEVESLLDKILQDYQDVDEGLALRVQDARSDIMVYHKKDYNKALRMFKKIMDEEGASVRVEVIKRVGDCYAMTNRWEEARWYYFRAHAMGMNPEQSKTLVQAIGEANEKLASKKGNMALEAYFKEVEKTL